MGFDSLEEAFEDLDKREYAFFAKALAAYRNALLEQGFSKSESFKLVAAYSKFIYDMGLEEYISERTASDFMKEDKDVDDDDDDLLS